MPFRSGKSWPEHIECHWLPLHQRPAHDLCSFPEKFQTTTNTHPIDSGLFWADVLFFSPYFSHCLYIKPCHNSSRLLWLELRTAVPHSGSPWTTTDGQWFQLISLLKTSAYQSTASQNVFKMNFPPFLFKVIAMDQRTLGRSLWSKTLGARLVLSSTLTVLKLKNPPPVLLSSCTTWQRLQQLLSLTLPTLLMSIYSPYLRW